MDDYDSIIAQMRQRSNRPSGQNLFQPSSELQPGGVPVGRLLPAMIGQAVERNNNRWDQSNQAFGSDMRTQQINQQGAQQANDITKYGFGRQQQFDQSFNNPLVQEQMARFMEQQGMKTWGAPVTPEMARFMQGFSPGINEHQHIAATLLSTYLPRLLVDQKGNNILDAQGQVQYAPEPDYIKWAKTALGLGGAQEGPGRSVTNNATQPTPHESTGLGGAARAAIGSGITTLGGVAGSKALPMLAKSLPFLNSVPGLKYAAPVAGALLANQGVQAMDPNIGNEMGEHWLASLLGGASPLLAKGFNRGMGLVGGPKVPEPQGVGGAARQATQKQVGGPTQRKALPAPGGNAPTMPQQGGPNLRDFVQRYQQQFGRMPTEQELEAFARGTFKAPQIPQLQAPYAGNPSMGNVSPYQQ